MGQSLKPVSKQQKVINTLIEHFSFNFYDDMCMITIKPKRLGLSHTNCIIENKQDYKIVKEVLNNEIC